MENDSVTEWIVQLKAGHNAAAQKLWDRYSQGLISIARFKLATAPRAAADEDDVAQSVFASICRAAALGRFQKVQSRDDLWWMLLAVTRHKVVDHIRRESAKRRGGARVRNETDLACNSENSRGYTLGQLIDESPSPEFMASLREEFDRLLKSLKDDRYRVIAISRIEGYTIPEIAAKMGVAVRTVERKLQIIRSQWSRELVFDD